jgi:hypothetical protein
LRHLARACGNGEAGAGQKQGDQLGAHFFLLWRGSLSPPLCKSLWGRYAQAD